MKCLIINPKHICVHKLHNMRTLNITFNAQLQVIEFSLMLKLALFMQVAIWNCDYSLKLEI